MRDRFKKFSTLILNNKKQILWVVTILLGLYFIFYVIKNADRQSHGFAAYYTASRLLIEGGEVGRFYNDEYFSSNVKRFVPEVYEIYLVNFPTTSLLLVPLASFDYKTARIIWTILNCIIISFSVILIIKKLQFLQHWIPLVIILFLIFQPLYANFAYGQAYIIIFSLMTAAWYAYTSEKYFLLGLSIGLMIILKSAAILLLLLLLIQKKWKSIAWSLTSVFFLFIITIPAVGFESWIIYSQKILAYSSAPELSVTAYQAIHSLFHHLTMFNPEWNPEPVIDLPVLGKSLAVLASLLIISVSMIYALKVKRGELSFGVFVIAGVILSPVSLDYHYVVMMLPLLIILDFIRTFESKGIVIALCLFYIMMALPIPYTSTKVTGGWLSLLAYPKLYGAAGILVIYLLIFFKFQLKAELIKDG